MEVRTIEICNPLGLHARAAAQLVRAAGRFESRILLLRKDNDVVADAKSILSVLTLAASRGTVLEMQVNGADELQAAEEIEKLVTSGFGEM